MTMMSKKLTHTLCATLAAGALAAVPTLSAAQGGEGQGQGKQEGQSQQRQQQQPQGSQQQGRQGEQQQEKITKRLTVHKSVSLPLANGCSYSATIDGTVSPTKQKQQQQQQQQEKGQAQAQGQMLDADLRVTASAICPNQATLTVSENVTRTGPLTHEALEEAIERRGTIFTASQGRSCAFVPDFRLSAQGVEGAGIAYMCAIQPGQGQQQQQGG